MTDITLRQLNEDDYDSYLALRLRGLREHPEGFGATYEEECSQSYDYHVSRIRPDRAKPHNFMLGAWKGETLVGMVSFVMESRAKQKHKAHVFGMYVVSEVQGSGVGRALLEEVISRARKIPGLEILLIGVVSENANAVRLYESCGFRRYGREPKAEKMDGRYWDVDELSLEL